MTVYRRPDPIPRPHPASSVSSSQSERAAPVTHRVADAIVDRILAGQYPEGSILPSEVDLCIALSVSRTALREAINGLTARGVLVPRRRSGTVILERTRWNLLDVSLLAACHRASGPRVLDDLWQLVSATLTTTIEDAVRKGRDGQIGAILRQAPTADSQALVDGCLEIVRLAGNYPAACVVTNGLACLNAVDPHYLAQRLPDLLDRWSVPAGKAPSSSVSA